MHLQKSELQFNQHPLALILVDLIEGFNHDFRGALALELFLEDEQNKQLLKKEFTKNALASFITIWDETLSVLHVLKEEGDPRLKKADMDLLDSDLDKLYGFFLMS